MIPFPDGVPDRIDDAAAEASVLAVPPEGEPVAPGVPGERVWQPVAASYDWYGATDPEGLMDVLPPFGRAPVAGVRPEVVG